MTSPDDLRTARASLDELRRYALLIGGDQELVQGAGGNLSAKSSESIWIKASGTRLSEANSRSIFVELNLKDARLAVLRTEDLSYLALDESELRPSIETAIHSLLPHRFVFHVHALGSIAFGLADLRAETRSRLESIAKVHVLPYAKPGIALANEIVRGLGDSMGNTDPLIIMLGNHGLITAAEDAQTAYALILRVEELFGGNPIRTPGPSGSPVEQSLPGWNQAFPPGTLSAWEQSVLTLGPFTPDEAVFLGPVPFTADSSAANSLALVPSDGSVWTRVEISADAAEIAHSFVKISQRILPGTDVRRLSKQQVEELVDWEAEKWRRQQER